MPTWLTIVLALGGSTLISLIITAVWHNMESKMKHIYELEKEARETKMREEDRARQEMWQNQIITMLQPVSEKVDDIKKQLDLDMEATVTSLRANMKSLLDHYREQGYADSSDKATWSELYDKYSRLGGNHFKEYVNRWKDELENFPDYPED